MTQLFTSTDCLNEIFEFLENDNVTLFSCLLVNHLWCKVAVRILWSNGLNYNNKTLITLITCLPNESKEILHNNKIDIPTPTSKPPMFNYAKFCKILNISKISYYINYILEIQLSLSIWKNLKEAFYMVQEEVHKMLMNQIFSLKKLYLKDLHNCSEIANYPGSEYSLKNLSELHCNSNIGYNTFYCLSQICHNLLLLNIEIIYDSIPEVLKNLIIAQKNLKFLYIKNSTKNLISLFTKLPNTLTKLIITEGDYIPLSPITRLTNLQMLRLEIKIGYLFENFEELQYANFPQLEILDIPIYGSSLNYESLTNFIEINGNNLKECYIGNHGTLYSGQSGDCDNLLNLAIAKSCLNLRKLSVGFKYDELETLKITFKSCQYLESIEIWCGNRFLSEKEALEMVVNYSPKNFCELKLFYKGYLQFGVSSEILESFFLRWSNRMPSKSLSLILIDHPDNYNISPIDKNSVIIKKYNELGIIKKCEYVSSFDFLRSKSKFSY